MNTNPVTELDTLRLVLKQKNETIDGLTAALANERVRRIEAEKIARSFWREQDRECKCSRCTAWERHMETYGKECGK